MNEFAASYATGCPLQVMGPLACEPTARQPLGSCAWVVIKARVTHRADLAAVDDRAFLATTGVKILMLGNPVFAMAVKSMYDGLKHLKDGGTIEALSDQQASSDLLQRVNRTDEILRLQQQFLWS